MKRHKKLRGILFESYNYDVDKDRRGDDPYEVCESHKFITVKQALRAAANDVKNWWKNDFTNFGGSVVVVNGNLVFNVLRSGDYECEDEKLKAMFEKYLYEEGNTFKEFLNGDSEYPLDESNEPFYDSDDFTDYEDEGEYITSDTKLDEDYQNEKFSELRDYNEEKVQRYHDKFIRSLFNDFEYDDDDIF